MANRIQLRRDTAAAWQSANPLLTPGEVGIDLTNKKIKIGDGITLWNSLEYWDDQEPIDFDGSYASLTSKPSLFSGSYVDLTNKPTIPAAQVNSDWNASSGVSQILNKPTVPEDVSDLTDTTNLLSGGDRLVNGSSEVALSTTGALSYPNAALQRDTGNVACAGNASTVVYISSGITQHTIRLLIQVEGFEGVETSFDTQACEMIIAKSFRANDIAASVYGIVHTSVAPLATFTAEWNAVTNRVEVLCTTPSANSVTVRTFATEITTSD